MSGIATGRALFDRVAPAANKYMATAFNNANTTNDLIIHRIRAIHSNPTTATGVILDFELRRISAMTVGAAVTPTMDDPETDTIAATHIFDSAPTAVTDGAVLDRFFRTGEEMILAADTLLLSGSTYQGSIVYDRGAGRGIVLSGTTAANRGLACKCVTSSTEGTVSFVFEFSVEPT